jgi:NAD(P)-dependent dehydrogenase (short-subunit alcohol dehydrogenase family)
MSMRLLITGAASGIGRAVALRAARIHAGSGLVLVDRDGAALDAVAVDVAATGAVSVAVVADVADPAGCTAAVARAERALGGLDALVSNAGILDGAPIRQLRPEQYQRTFDVNTRPTLLLAQAAYPSLRASRGAIVATGSISAEHATPPLGAYSASKAALVMLVRQLALEWGPDGIRANVVSPGPTLTGMTSQAFGDGTPEQRRNRARREEHIPLRRVGTPDDIAAAVLFLAGPSASFITGVNLAVDGGLTIGLMPAVGGGLGHV